MSLESQIGSLVEAANNLTGEVAGKMQEIDQKADSLIDDHESATDPHDQYLTESRAKSKLEIYVPDPLRRSVEAASGGRVTIFYTDRGQPSYFHILPKFLCEDIAPGGELGTGIFPAFLNDGEEESEIYIGQFAASQVSGEGVSQPGRVPRRSIDYDASRALARASGAGFDLMSVWDWAALHYWTQASGFSPRGNTDFGRHHDERHETGIREDRGTPGLATTGGGTLTGSGPMSWRHDGTPAGVADTVGNMREWLSGLKTVDNRVFLSADNGRTDEESLIDTGFDLPVDTRTAFNDIEAPDAPLIVLQAMIVPTGAHPMEGAVWSSSGERFARRGGSRGDGANCGPAALALRHRDASTAGNGFRIRYRKP